MELPYNAEAEKQVLANMIFSSDMLVETFSRLSADDFYLKEHQIIFKTLKTIFDNNKAKVEPYALIDKLSIDGNLDKVGDASYILELMSSYIDIANATYYINSVEEKAILRKLINTCSNVVNKWPSESSGDITNYINKIERDITDITKKRRVEDFISISEAFSKYIENVSYIKSGKGNSTGLLTGFSTFDKDIDNKLDKFIRLKQNATSKDFPCLLMHYPPKPEKISIFKIFKNWVYKILSQ